MDAWDADVQRLAVLARAFAQGLEEWLDDRDCRLLGIELPAEGLGPGERISSETRERRYSAAWL